MRCFARPSLQSDRDKRVIVFIDGENLVLRYQAMRDEGKSPLNATTHIPDTFVWHPDILRRFHTPNLIRIAYYTSMVGSDPDIDKARQDIAAIEYPITTRTNHRIGTGRLVPRLFKRPKRGVKSRAVDINITTDAMCHIMNNDIDEICIISGDGDFLPLIRTAMSRGVTSHVLSLSSGLSDSLRVEPDRFEIIDDAFFSRQE